MPPRTSLATPPDHSITFDTRLPPPTTSGKDYAAWKVNAALDGLAKLGFLSGNAFAIAFYGSARAPLALRGSRDEDGMEHHVVDKLLELWLEDARAAANLPSSSYRPVERTTRLPLPAYNVNLGTTAGTSRFLDEVKNDFYGGDKKSDEASTVPIAISGDFLTKRNIDSSRAERSTEDSRSRQHGNVWSTASPLHFELNSSKRIGECWYGHAPHHNAADIHTHTQLIHSRTLNIASPTFHLSEYVFTVSASARVLDATRCDACLCFLRRSKLTASAL
jgi:hypothetical protein